MSHQPYTRGARQPGPVLDAMRRGRSPSLGNPQDQIRATQAPAAKRLAETRPQSLGEMLLRMYFPRR